MSKNLLLFFVLLLLLLVANNNAADINPYKILGVTRNADEQEIRNAYKRLARAWHPDKNKAPDAHDKFMKINQAYEILSDQERRRLYDEYGTTSEPRDGSSAGYGRGGGFHHQFHGFDSFFNDPFESFFGRGGGGGRFGHEHQRNSEEAVNKRFFDETIMPNSHTKPYILFSFTDFCFSCMTVDAIWQTFKQEIKNIGMGIGHFDASWNRDLAKSLGISTVPSIVAIVNGKIYHYKSNDRHEVANLKTLREFARKLIPVKLITDVNLNNFNKTLHQTVENDNKVFALFVTPNTANQISLRYQMPCFQMQDYIKCAAIKMNSIDPNFDHYLRTDFNIELPNIMHKQESLFVFKENVNKYLLAQSSEISYAQILQTFESNRFLQMPRLSSSQVFYDVCTSWSAFDAKKSICLVLLVESRKPSSLLTLLRKLAISSDDFFAQNNVQLMYVYRDVQNEFVDTIVKSSRKKRYTTSTNKVSDDDQFENLVDKVLLVKRLDDKYMQFDWVQRGDDDDEDEQKYVEAMRKHVVKVVRGSDEGLVRTPIPYIYDESAPGYVDVFFEFADDVCNYFTQRFSWDKFFDNSSYMMILICTILFIWLMMMLSAEKSYPQQQQQQQARQQQQQQKRQQRQQQQQQQQRTAQTTPSSNNTAQQQQQQYDRPMQKNCVEMNAKNYTQLVPELPAGQRTILLITTSSHGGSSLIEAFGSVRARYGSYKLKWAYVNNDTYAGQKWLNEIKFDNYKQVDDETDVEDEDTVSMVGTPSKRKSLVFDSDTCISVIAINAQRKYFNVFSFDLSKHRNGNHVASSLGLDEDEDDVLGRFMSELIDWLDKLTEGLCLEKYTVNEWPSFSNN